MTRRCLSSPPDGDLLDLMTAEEVAGVLRTTRKAVYAMVERCALPPPVRLGRRVLFVRSDLIRWVGENRAASPGGARR